MAVSQIRGLSATDIADHLAVTKQTVYNWLNRDGLQFTETPKGKIVSLRDLIDWHVRRADSQPVKPVKSTPSDEAPEAPETFDQAILRKTKAEADLKELQLARERGQVAAISDVEKVLSAAVMAVQTQVLAVPSRLATQMLGLEDHARAVSILTAEMRQLLSNLPTIDAVREAGGIGPEAGDDE